MVKINFENLNPDQCKNTILFVKQKDINGNQKKKKRPITNTTKFKFQYIVENLYESRRKTALAYKTNVHFCYE